MFSFSLLPLAVAMVVIVGHAASVDAFLSSNSPSSPPSRIQYTTFLYVNKEEAAAAAASSGAALPTDEDIAFPCPDIDAVQVTTLCMDALKNMRRSELSLEVCFNFSTDRCRAAVGGSLPKFIQYAANPVFGALVHCDDYEIVSLGPVIPGGKHRGAMQTVLIDVQKHKGGSGVSGGAARNGRLLVVLEQEGQAKKKRPTAEERAEARRQEQRQLRRQEERDDDDDDTDKEEPAVLDDGKRRFLWTLQQERRPPRQDCWLIHEVLFIKNAYALTL
jgi:hypothetical protein